MTRPPRLQCAWRRTVCRGMQATRLPRRKSPSTNAATETGSHHQGAPLRRLLRRPSRRLNLLLVLRQLLIQLADLLVQAAQQLERGKPSAVKSRQQAQQHATGKLRRRTAAGSTAPAAAPASHLSPRVFSLSTAWSIVGGGSVGFLVPKMRRITAGYGVSSLAADGQQRRRQSEAAAAGVAAGLGKPGAQAGNVRTKTRDQRGLPGKQRQEPRRTKERKAEAGERWRELLVSRRRSRTCETRTSAVRAGGRAPGLQRVARWAEGEGAPAGRTG